MGDVKIGYARPVNLICRASEFHSFSSGTNDTVDPGNGTAVRAALVAAADRTAADFATHRPAAALTRRPRCPGPDSSRRPRFGRTAGSLAAVVPAAADSGRAFKFGVRLASGDCLPSGQKLQLQSLPDPNRYQ